MKCMNCGTEFSQGNYCPQCGCKVESISFNKDQTKNNIEVAEKKTKKGMTSQGWLILLIVLIAIIVVGLVLIGIFVPDDGTDKEKAATKITADQSTTEEVRQKADKDERLEVGKSYVVDATDDEHVKITVNEAGVEPVGPVQNDVYQDQIIYLDCKFENVGDKTIDVGPEWFAFYADNKHVDIGADSMDQEYISTDRETSGTIYALVNPDDVTVLEVEFAGKAFILKDSEGSVFESSSSEISDNEEIDGISDEEATEEESTEEESADRPDAENMLLYNYFIADSDTRVIEEGDYSYMTWQELCYAKNEIYARHGYIFKSQELQDVFESKQWYKKSKKFTKNPTLSKIEAKNVETLREAEMEAGDGSLYPLDGEDQN